MYDEVVNSCGRDAVEAFSKQVDLKSIRVICLLGEGAFARVYLIKKNERAPIKSCYYAMKVIEKKTL